MRDSVLRLPLRTLADRFTVGWNPDVREHDGLMYPIERTRDRSSIILRQAEGHDWYTTVYLMLVFSVELLHNMSRLSRL